MRRALPVLALLVALPALSACTPLGVGITAGSTAGVASAREGGIKASLDDARISAKVSDLWFRKDFEMFRKLNITVDQGRVLLTGVVQKPEHRVEAVRLAWQAEGVRQVINEIKVANSEGIGGWARDNWISGRLKAELLFDKDIQSVNYSIDTVQAIVYLMGVAQNQEELNLVMSHARNIPYVKQVVSYVKMAGQPLNQVIPPSLPPSVSATVGQEPVPYNNNYGGTYSTEPARDYVIPNPAPVESQPLPGPTTGGPINPAQPYRPQPIIDQGF